MASMGNGGDGGAGSPGGGDSQSQEIDLTEEVNILQMETSALVDYPEDNEENEEQGEIGGQQQFDQDEMDILGMDELGPTAGPSCASSRSSNHQLSAPSTSASTNGNRGSVSQIQVTEVRGAVPMGSEHMRKNDHSYGYKNTQSKSRPTANQMLHVRGASRPNGSNYMSQATKDGRGRGRPRGTLGPPPPLRQMRQPIPSANSQNKDELIAQLNTALRAKEADFNHLVQTNENNVHAAKKHIITVESRLKRKLEQKERELAKTTEALQHAREDIISKNTILNSMSATITFQQDRMRLLEDKMSLAEATASADISSGSGNGEEQTEARSMSSAAASKCKKPHYDIINPAEQELRKHGIFLLNDGTNQPELCMRLPLRVNMQNSRMSITSPDIASVSPLEASRRKAAVVKLVEILSNPLRTAKSESHKQQLVRATISDLLVDCGIDEPYEAPQWEVIDVPKVVSEETNRSLLKKRPAPATAAGASNAKQDPAAAESASQHQQQQQQQAKPPEQSAIGSNMSSLNVFRDTAKEESIVLAAQMNNKACFRVFFKHAGKNRSLITSWEIPEWPEKVPMAFLPVSDSLDYPSKTLLWVPFVVQKVAGLSPCRVLRSSAITHMVRGNLVSSKLPDAKTRTACRQCSKEVYMRCLREHQAAAHGVEMGDDDDDDEANPELTSHGAVWAFSIDPAVRGEFLNEKADTLVAQQVLFLRHVDQPEMTLMPSAQRCIKTEVDYTYEVAEAKRFRCNWCSKQFSSTVGWEAHLESDHKADKPFKCGATNCQRKFFTKQELNFHQRSCVVFKVEVEDDEEEEIEGATAGDEGHHGNDEDLNGDDGDHNGDEEGHNDEEDDELEAFIRQSDEVVLDDEDVEQPQPQSQQQQDEEEAAHGTDQAEKETTAARPPKMKVASYDPTKITKSSSKKMRMSLKDGEDSFEINRDDPDAEELAHYHKKPERAAGKRQRAAAAAEPKTKEQPAAAAAAPAPATSPAPKPTYKKKPLRESQAPDFELRKPSRASMEKRRQRHPQVAFTGLLKDILINVNEYVKKLRPKYKARISKTLFNQFQLRAVEDRIDTNRYSTSAAMLVDFELEFDVDKTKDITADQRETLESFSQEVLQYARDEVAYFKELLDRLEKEINNPAGDPQQAFKYALERIIDEDVRALKSARQLFSPVSKKTCPEYYEAVKKPLSVECIRQKVSLSEYKNKDEYVADFQQLHDNCVTFYGADHAVVQAAQDILQAVRNGLDKYNEHVIV